MRLLHPHGTAVELHFKLREPKVQCLRACFCNHSQPCKLNCSYTSYDKGFGPICNTKTSHRGGTLESIVRHTRSVGLTQYMHHSITVALTGVKEECFEGLCTHRWAFGSNPVPHTDCHRECMLPQNCQGTQGEAPLVPGHTAFHSAFQSQLSDPSAFLVMAAAALLLEADFVTISTIQGC